VSGGEIDSEQREPRVAVERPHVPTPEHAFRDKGPRLIGSLFHVPPREVQPVGAAEVVLKHASAAGDRVSQGSDDTAREASRRESLRRVRYLRACCPRMIRHPSGAPTTDTCTGYVPGPVVTTNACRTRPQRPARPTVQGVAERFPEHPQVSAASLRDRFHALLAINRHSEHREAHGHRGHGWRRGSQRAGSLLWALVTQPRPVRSRTTRRGRHHRRRRSSDSSPAPCTRRSSVPSGA
jgi:hypothetical protein